MVEIALVALCAVTLISALKWRSALVLCVAVALIQDPLRKIAPGQPRLDLALRKKNPRQPLDDRTGGFAGHGLEQG